MKASELIGLLMVAPNADVLVDIGFEAAEANGIEFNKNLKRYVMPFGVDNEYFLDSNVILLEL